MRQSNPPHPSPSRHSQPSAQLACVVCSSPPGWQSRSMQWTSVLLCRLIPGRHLWFWKSQDKVVPRQTTPPWTLLGRAVWSGLRRPAGHHPESCPCEAHEGNAAGGWQCSLGPPPRKYVGRSRPRGPPVPEQRIQHHQSSWAEWPSPTVWKMEEVLSGLDLSVGGSPVLSGVTGSTHPVTPCCPYLEGGFQSEPHVSFCQLPLSSPLLWACQGLLPLSFLSAGDVLHGLGVLVYGAVR